MVIAFADTVGCSGRRDDRIARLDEATEATVWYVSVVLDVKSDRVDLP